MKPTRYKGLSFFTTLLMVVMLTTPTAFATILDPEYTQPILDPATQNRWLTPIPNALMAAFTYTPHTNATAIAAGFPAGICGVSEDCYTISVRQFQQDLGLIDEITGAPLLTTVNGYGTATNAPGGVAGVGSIWHAPSPTFRSTSNRPYRVTWVNELPNVQPPGHDPTVDGGPNAPNNYPYNRIVTHMHGAHVQDDSDGYPEAWYTPGFALTGTTYAPSIWGPPGTYRYENTQEAATTWYHDHASGLTHLNTNMGMAGFSLITDDNEKCLQGQVVTGCAAPVKLLPTDPYEVGFALQDRNFWPDGSLAMPDKPVRDLLNVSCAIDPLTGLVIPETCPTVPFSKAPDGHLIPYDAAIADTSLRGPFTATNTTLEYFGNVPLVNGVVYGKYDVEPRVYRMRFIGGTDSRTWILQLEDRAAPGVPIPFWQIGSEQGFLNNPVQRTSMDLMPGERIDVLVDLKTITVGHKLVLKNLGPDAPYEGLIAAPAPASTVIPEIMEFTVVARNEAIADVPSPTVLTNLRPVSGTIAALPAPTAPVRNVSLIEVTDNYGRTMPTIDDRGFMPMGIPITERIKLNDVEEWDIINTTVDAHPMHLHLVSFQLIDRVQYDPATFVPPVNDMVNSVFQQPSWTPLPGTTVAPAAWEAGWKDTIDCPPGHVTRVKARFDIAGLYVWHCHILSHEEHDMMRPFAVETAPSFTVTGAAGPDGALTGTTTDGTLTTAIAAGAASVTPSSSVTYTFTPAAGFEVSGIVVDGAFTQGNLSGYTFTNVKADHYLNVYFQAIPNTITLGVGAGGTVTGAPAGGKAATGSTVTYTFVPDAGFEVDSIVVDGTMTPSTAPAPLTSHTFTNVTADHYINVYFRPIPNTITLGIGGAGTVTVTGAPAPVAGKSPAASGSTVNYTFTPDAGNRVAAIVVDGLLTLNDPAAPLSNYSFAGVAADHYINVYFESIPALASFTISSATNNPAFGTITHTHPDPVTQGTNATYTLTPTGGHTLAGIVVDGVFIPGPRASYTFTNVQSDHYINAYFQ